MADESNDIRGLVHSVVQEFIKAEHSRSEPAYKTELQEEKRRRETLEQRVNELVAENERARAKAEEAERSSTIRVELQKLGVAKWSLPTRQCATRLSEEMMEGFKLRMAPTIGT